jgi:tight adherence protein B
MPIVIALLVFVRRSPWPSSPACLYSMSARPRLACFATASPNVQGPAEQTLPDVALLRDEVLSRIPAFDTFLRRSERVSALQKVLAQGNVDVRAGNFLMLCAISAVVFAIDRLLSPAAISCSPGPAPCSVFSSLTPTPPTCAPEALRKFEEKFPEAIDTLARAVRAGHAFTTALEMIANEVAEPVAGEFRQLYEEQKFGLPVRDALINLADRVPLVDVKFFVTAVMLQRETGGNLAEILDNLSYVIRERFKILRQVRVHTAQGRLTMMLLMALPPTVVLVMQLLNPGFHSSALHRSHRPRLDRRRHQPADARLFLHS